MRESPACDRHGEASRSPWSRSILLAVALSTGDSTLLLVLAALALPLVISPVVVLARASRAAGVEIHMMVTPPLVPVGAPCALLVQLSHSGAADLPPLGLDRPSDHWNAGASTTRPSTRPVPPRVALAADVARLIRWDRIDSDTSASSTVALPTGRRGVFTIGPLRLWVHDPFAFCGLVVATARPVTLVVHPALVADTAPPAVRPGWSGATQFRDGPAGTHTDDPGGEWSGLRPYEPGDRLHLLSWQAEARSGDLLVHDFRPDSEELVTIVFDDRAGVHRRHAFEEALGAVLGLATAGKTAEHVLRRLDAFGAPGSRLDHARRPRRTVDLPRRDPAHSFEHASRPRPHCPSRRARWWSRHPPRRPPFRRLSITVPLWSSDDARTSTSRARCLPARRLGDCRCRGRASVPGRSREWGHRPPAGRCCDRISCSGPPGTEACAGAHPGRRGDHRRDPDQPVDGDRRRDHVRPPDRAHMARRAIRPACGAAAARGHWSSHSVPLRGSSSWRRCSVASWRCWHRSCCTRATHTIVCTRGSRSSFRWVFLRSPAAKAHQGRWRSSSSSSSAPEHWP